MAANTPDRSTLNPEVAERLKIKKPDEKRTPASTAQELTQIEQETLEHLRDRHRGFWERAGRMTAYAVPFMSGENPTAFGDYKMRLREKASEEARTILERMDDLSSTVTHRLRWYSLTHAKRLAEVTARVNVSTRALHALRKQRELLKQDQLDLRAIAEGIREQQKSDRPFRTRVPLVRRLYLPREKDLDALGASENDKLMKAAQEVKSESLEKKRSLEASATERFKGARKAEMSLRSRILHHNPQAVDTIEQQLRDCAAGNNAPLLATIALLELKGMTERQKEEVRRLMERAVETLSGRSGTMSKAFEVAGRVEVSGSPTEVLHQIRSMPLGTRLELTLTKPTAREEEVVLSAKAPEPYLIFKVIGKDQEVAVDPKQSVAWRAVRYSAKMTEFAQSISKKIAEAAKQAKAKPKLVHDIVKKARTAILAKRASDSSLKAAVNAATQPPIDAAIKTAVLGAVQKLNFPEKDKKPPFYEQAIDLNTMQFALAA